MSTWRNRIVAEGEADPREIQANPLNWRVHPKVQRETLEDSLNCIGWIQKPIINRATGNLIDGHLRVASAAANQETRIPVSYVDLSIEEERAVLASLDPMAGMAVMDGEKLTELLQDLELGSGALDAMFDDLREQADGATLSPSKNSASTLQSDGSPVIKAVIAVTNLAVIEQALTATGQASRGDALLLLCQAYLNHQPAGETLQSLPDEDLNEKGQYDARPENVIALQPAQKDPKPHRDGDPRRQRPGVEKGVQRDPAGRRVRGKTRPS